MKKLMTVILVFMISGVQAQVRKSTVRRPARRTAGVVENSKTIPVAQTPIFLSRKGPASISEMISAPPTFSYGSSINVWLARDMSGEIQEIGITGHGDSATCRRVSGQVMSMFLEKTGEDNDLFVAGAAYMVDRGDVEKKKELEQTDVVKEFLRLHRDYLDAVFLVKNYEKNPSAGTEERSALQKAREDKSRIEQQLIDTLKEPLVAEYLRESKSADAFDMFVKEVKEFARENGLVTVHEIPFKPLEEARERIRTAVSTGKALTVSFEDLLKNSKTPESALFAPVLTLPEAKPLELRIPRAKLKATAFEQARRNNRDDIEQAIIGNARQRLEVFNKNKKDALQDQKLCNTLSAAQKSEIVTLNQRVTVDGDDYVVDGKIEKPTRMTRGEYCSIQVPLNLQLIDNWIKQVEKLLKSVEVDSNSRLEDFTDSTLIDSMLRDWQLPVGRSQASFDAWRKSVRNPVWNSLIAQLAQRGIARDVLSGEQMIFSIRVEAQDIVVRPLHIIDMARSVVVIDPAAKATRVLDAWSLRTDRKSTFSVSESGVPGLINNMSRNILAGNQRAASEDLTKAFSLDPGLAFKELEKEWLRQFPDTYQRLRDIQRSVQPVIEAAEWFDAYERLQNNPALKENPYEYIREYEDFLESYPNAPVDLHLKFALYVADALVTLNNDSNNALSVSANPWDVIDIFNLPPVSVSPRRSSNAAALKGWRTRLENKLRLQGVRGQRLQQIVNAQEEIEISSLGRIDKTTNFVRGRKIVALEIYADPFPMIEKAIQTVKQRDSEYWNNVVRTREVPKIPSREWNNAIDVMQRELNLFENGAQSLSRLEDGLTKSYWGSQAADYLWSSPNLNLKELLSMLDVAVGDGKTGSSSSYFAAHSKVKLFLNQRRVMDTLTRLQNANSLNNGSKSLLSIARSRILDRPYFEPFRESLSLRSRLWFESGEYLKSMKTLFTESIPIALYHPALKWEVLPGDVAQKPLALKARRAADGRVIFTADFDGNKQSDVLALTGLSEIDGKVLIEDFSKIPDSFWNEYGKVSDQILLTPVLVRPATSTLREFILSKDMQLIIMKSMIYGHNVPSDELVKAKKDSTALAPVISILDQVKSDQGQLLKVPMLAEVKQIAEARISEKK